MTNRMPSTSICSPAGAGTSESGFLIQDIAMGGMTNELGFVSISWL